MANPFIHVELNTADPEKVKAFYSQVFDWQFEEMPNSGVPDNWYTMMKLPAAKKYVYDRLADGRFHPKVARIFPFAQAVEAYKYLESNAQERKVVITVP